MKYEHLVNDYASTLSAGINNSVTSLSVASATGLPSDGNFRLTLYAAGADPNSAATAKEIVLVTAISGTTLTITRGQEGTTAQAWSSGDNIVAAVTQKAVQLYRAAGHRSLDYTPPDGSTFAWVNQGGASYADTDNVGLVLTAPGATGGLGWRVLKKSAPATPYTVTARILAPALGKDSIRVGIGFRESGSGKLQIFEVGQTSISVFRWTNASTFSASDFSQTIDQDPEFLQISDDGTNRIYRVSADGINFVQITSMTRTTFLTPDEILFAASGDHNSTPVYDVVATLVHWTVT